MHAHPSSNLLLSEFDDVDKIRNIATVLNADDGTGHLVYREDYPIERCCGMELNFDVAGYLITFNLPGRFVPQRYGYWRNCVAILCL